MPQVQNIPPTTKGGLMSLAKGTYTPFTPTLFDDMPINEVFSNIITFLKDEYCHEILADTIKVRYTGRHDDKGSPIFNWVAEAVSAG